MEKLEPVIRHRFWILFGVVLILAPIGWWKGTSNLANETAAQKKKIKDAESGIPTGAGHENDKNWTEPLRAINVTRSKQYDKQAGRLYAMQRKTMKWPNFVSSVMDKAPFFEKPDLAGSSLTEQEANQVRTIYADFYIPEAKRVHKLVDPVEVKQAKNPDTGDMETVVTGTVEYPYAKFPVAKNAPWNERSPEFPEMWKAQLDLWLMESLLKTVKRVNDRHEAKTIFDSAIKQIVTLTLHGGSRGDSKKKASPQGQGRRIGEAPQEPAGGRLGNQAEERPGMGRGQPQGTTLTVDPTVVLGPERVEEPKKKAAARTPRQPLRGGPPGAESGQSASGTPSPWVEETANFKTRGFVLRVVMRRMDIPLLIRELTDANQTNFPCEILWINSVDLDQDHEGSRFLLDFDRRRARANGKAGAKLPVPEGRLGAPEVNGNEAPGANRAANIAYAAAMSESELSDVVIIGVMTVYMKPEVKKKSAKNQAGKGSPKNQKPPTPPNVKSGAKKPADSKKKSGLPKGQTPPKSKGTIEPGGPKKKPGNGPSTPGKPAGS